MLKPIGPGLHRRLQRRRSFAPPHRVDLLVRGRIYSTIYGTHPPQFLLARSFRFTVYGDALFNNQDPIYKSVRAALVWCLLAGGGVVLMGGSMYAGRNAHEAFLRECGAVWEFRLRTARRTRPIRRSARPARRSRA